MRDAYLNLATLLTQSGEGSVAQKVRDALAALSSPVATVTLDLSLSKDLFADTDVELVVQVLRETWPTPACCLARCDNPLAWSRAAASVSQPLIGMENVCEAGWVSGARSSTSWNLCHAASRTLHFAHPGHGRAVSARCTYCLSWKNERR